jgi:hypothetical protein
MGPQCFAQYHWLRLPCYLPPPKLIGLPALNWRSDDAERRTSLLSDPLVSPGMEVAGEVVLTGEGVEYQPHGLSGWKFARYCRRRLDHRWDMASRSEASARVTPETPRDGFFSRSSITSGTRAENLGETAEHKI